jgi:hypothetical protein
MQEPTDLNVVEGLADAGACAPELSGWRCGRKHESNFSFVNFLNLFQRDLFGISYANCFFTMHDAR